jgi:saccharopine dehydrogenase-like NADP-dependent oxidoreductase
MKKNVVVLGGGMIGSVIAHDLAQGDFAVTVVDVRAEAVARLRAAGLGAVQADLADPAAVARAVASADLVVLAVPSAIAFAALGAVLEARKPCCDVSFTAEDTLTLSPLAEAQGVTCVVDCGVAPGVSNMMCGYGVSQLDRAERVEIVVGGLPTLRRWPWEYKAGFSPADVIEEYVRPARLVEHGQVVVKEALSEPELLDFPGVGTLEAFNTDGLRSLVHTLAGVPHMRERTMRYPGHVALMRVLRDLGLFGKTPIEVGGAKVRPLDLTHALLFPKWTFADGEADQTIMRITVEGERAARRFRYVWDLHDHYDPHTGFRSMSRTTAFPAAIVARLIADGRFARPGVFPPEILAREPGILDHVLAELQRRGVTYRARVETLWG